MKVKEKYVKRVTISLLIVVLLTRGAIQVAPIRQGPYSFGSPIRSLGQRWRTAHSLNLQSSNNRLLEYDHRRTFGTYQKGVLSMTRVGYNEFSAIPMLNLAN